jgi:hypothetical protein
MLMVASVMGRVARAKPGRSSINFIPINRAKVSSELTLSKTAFKMPFGTSSIPVSPSLKGSYRKERSKEISKKSTEYIYN